MGQAIGRAPLLPVARHYVNSAPRRRFTTWPGASHPFSPPPPRLIILSLHPTVPCTSVHHLWDAFNDIAEGFGLT